MGNQMFEYAFARALSLRGGMDIFIDTAGLNPKNIQVSRSTALK